MFSAMLLTISTVALAQFAVYYWRAVVSGVAAQPVSEEVLAAAQVQGTVHGRDFRALAELHQLTPDLEQKGSSLGLVRCYFELIHAVGTLATGRLASLAGWAERERLLCARYAAVQVERRLQANLALAASIRSC
jgi:hypothetical protein